LCADFRWQTLKNRILNSRIEIMKKTILFITLSLFTTLIIAQEHKEYYNNGTLKVEGQYENEQQTGEWKIYHENGQLQRIGKYENGK